MCSCALVTKHCHSVKVMLVILVLPSEIDDMREVALFWHWLWIENGRRRLGHVADIMRRTRAKYHYTVRYTKRCENDRRKRKMAESVSTNNQRDLWLETRVLARDQSASLEDWQNLARTGEIVWFYNWRDRKKTGKIARNGHFGRAVSESWLNPC